MTSQRERSRNNVQAGIFVTVTLFLGLAILVALTNLWTALTTSSREHTARFSVTGGVSRIERGSKVFVGGVPLGTVERIDPRIEAGGPFREIDVVFKLDDRISLYRDARIRVGSALIGSDAWLEISSVGTMGDPQDGVIIGQTSGRLLDAVLGPESAGVTDTIILDVAETVARAKDVATTFDENAGAIVEDVRAASEDVRAFTGTFREETWPGWSQQMDAIFAWTADATDEIDAIFAEGRVLVTDAHGVVTESRAAIDSARPRIDSTLENVEASSDDIRAVTIRARETWVNDVDRILESGERAVSGAESAIDEMRAATRGWVPTVDETFADVRLSAGQLKLALTEIRRNPWKVLYQPTTDELEHELLYEAARTFAVAAADLKGASLSIEHVMEAFPDRVREDEETFDYMKERLLDALTRYDRAQQRLFDVLQLEMEVTP